MKASKSLLACLLVIVCIAGSCKDKTEYPIETIIENGTYIGEITGVANPPFTNPPLPGTARGFQSEDGMEYVLSYDSQWYWGDEDLVIEGVEYSLGDEVEITGTVSMVQLDESISYNQLEIETIAKKSN